MKHTVVISDVHLCEAVPGDELWMRYRQRKYFPDQEFSELFDRLRRETSPGELSLVFNGDLFDFDAPAVIDGQIRFDDLPRSESIAIEALLRVLADHTEFMLAIGRVLADKNTVVFVSGNHDAQLAWPGVRALLRTRVIAAAHDAGSHETHEALDARITFRTWFHRTDDGIHIEHGNQYDSYCSFRYPMEPFTDDGTSVQPTMGSLSFRHLASRMGFFNPHVDSSFMLTGPQYAAHWATHYLFSKHSLAVTWALGALRVAGNLVKHRQRGDAARAQQNLMRCAQETGIDPSILQRHAALYASPSEDQMHPVLRELWLDRVGLGTMGVAAVAIAAVGGPLLATKLAVVAAGAIAAYELSVPKPPLSDTYVHTAGRQREIAQIYGSKAVIFGHTHVPYGKWDRSVFYGNSGTWSAAYHDIECTIPIDAGRPVIWLRSDERGVLSGGLYRWQSGDLLENVPTRGDAPIEIGPLAKSNA